ncbi:hypothetical protein KKIDH5335_44950 (plasmid) [Vibrio fluvialis]|nr:hypothetical protein KKIDH5335_44950 [Vibrio fluvialis]
MSERISQGTPFFSTYVLQAQNIGEVYSECASIAFSDQFCSTDADTMYTSYLDIFHLSITNSILKVSGFKTAANLDYEAYTKTVEAQIYDEHN